MVCGGQMPGKASAPICPHLPLEAAMLTLGQVRDVCLQIRAWREQGELDRAAYWSRRLRGEPARCSVLDCASPPLPDRPWCDEHRMVRLREPERRRRPTPEERMRDILDLIRR